MATFESMERLGPDDAQRVLQRAAELDREHAVRPPILDPNDLVVDEAELEKIGAASGLSPEAVRRALLERRAPPSTLRGAQATRTFEAAPAELEASLTRTLRSCGLEPVEQAPHLLKWEPAPGPHKALGRLVDWRGSSVWIGANLESSVYAVAEGKTAVKLKADAQLGASVATIAGLLLAVPAAFAMLVVLALSLRWGFQIGHALALSVIVACWALTTTAITKSVTRKRRRKMQRALERILSALAPSLH